MKRQTYLTPSKDCMENVLLGIMECQQQCSSLVCLEYDTAAKLLQESRLLKNAMKQHANVQNQKCNWRISMAVWRKQQEWRNVVQVKTHKTLMMVHQDSDIAGKNTWHNVIQRALPNSTAEKYKLQGTNIQTKWFQVCKEVVMDFTPNKSESFTLLIPCIFIELNSSSMTPNKCNFDIYQ